MSAILSLDAPSLAAGFKALKEGGFEYNETNKPFYEALIQCPGDASSLAAGFKTLKEGGFEYNATNKPLYETLIQCPLNASSLAAGFKAIKKNFERAGFPYEDRYKTLYARFSHLFPYVTNESESVAIDITIAFISLQQEGFAYNETFKFLYDACFPVSSSFSFSHFKEMLSGLLAGVKTLKELGFECNEAFKPFYNAVITASQTASGRNQMWHLAALYKEFTEEEKRLLKKIILNLISKLNDSAQLSDSISTTIKMMQYIKILGQDALIQLNQAMTAGAPGLERFCNQFCDFPLDTQKNLRIFYEKTPRRQKTRFEFDQFLLALSLLFYLEVDYNLKEILNKENLDLKSEIESIYSLLLGKSFLQKSLLKWGIYPYLLL